MFACVRLYPEGQDLAWRYVTGGKILTAPVELPGEHMYLIVAEDRFVHAVDEQGTGIWSYNLRKKPAPFLSVSPDGIIHVCLSDGTVIALNKLGMEIWRTGPEEITAAVNRNGGGTEPFIPREPAVYKSDGTILLHNGSVVLGLSHRG